MKYHLTLRRLAKIRNLREECRSKGILITNILIGVYQKEYIINWEWNGNQFGVFREVEHSNTCRPATSTLQYVFSKISFIQEDVCENIHSLIVPKGKLETAQMPINIKIKHIII